jgi:capsule polysaccharide export protein KpsE/RkpR
MKSSPQGVLPELPNTAVWNSEEIAGTPIELLPLVRSYVARWPLMMLALVGGAALLYAASFLVTPQFESTAVFLPPTNKPSVSENPLAALVSAPSTGTLYPGLLKSNSVVDTVLRDLDLDRQFKAKDHEEARTILRKHTTVVSDTAGFYTLSVDDTDRQRAKAIADKYLEALAQINNRLAVDQATQERAVYDQQLLNAKNDLEKAEEALAAMEKSSGVVSAQSQTLAGLTAINQLRAEITQREVDLAALRKAQTEESPAVVRLRAQIDALQAELESMEKGSGGGAGAGLSAARAPEANLQYMRLQRDVLYQQTLFEILTKQFESTQLQAIATPGVQIVDYPELPEKKAKPRRSMWALAGGVVAFFGLMVLIFIEDRYRVVRGDPGRSNELTGLAQAALHPRVRL